MPTRRLTKQEPKRADVAVATAWVQNRLIFDETPLAEVAEEFNRYNRGWSLWTPSLGLSGSAVCIRPPILIPCSVFYERNRTSS